ncbi:hypothetical protein ABT300_00975 [Streptomyces sp. NPDC001027]|uniref:hypothetical protein n=1 Tax=Streptomyces sp. NPDC001027 TaxID=3154771 RepID=UPI00332CE682
MTLPADELGPLLDRLSSEHRVYVRAGRLRGVGEAWSVERAVAEEAHSLGVRLYEEYWHRYVTDGPIPAEQIELSLYPKDPAEAVALMSRFASRDLLFSDFTLMDPTEARSIADRVVRLLGPEARWWSNTDGPVSEGLVGCTLDGLVVGTDGVRFAALIQVADD